MVHPMRNNVVRLEVRAAQTTVLRIDSERAAVISLAAVRESRRRLEWWNRYANALRSMCDLSEKEYGFCRQMSHRTCAPTPRQAAWLRDLYDDYFGTRPCA